MENEKQLICARCGHPWGQVNNVCENPECKGFCTWGYEIGKPLSYEIKEDGKWVPNKPSEGGFFDGMSAVHDPLQNMSVDDIGKQIREGSYNMVKKTFDLDEVFDFCQTHRVEVLVQADTMVHCYIDYKEGEGSWSTEFDGFTALVMGIKKYKEYHEKKSR